MKKVHTLIGNLRADPYSQRDIVDGVKQPRTIYLKLADRHTCVRVEYSSEVRKHLSTIGAHIKLTGTYGWDRKDGRRVFYPTKVDQV